jgi:hypothetical protein
LIDELVPCVATVVDDAVDLKIRFESQFSRMNCQTFSWGVSSGHFAGNGIRVMLGGTMSRPDKMSAGLIDEQRGVCAQRDLGGYLLQVQVHGFGVASAVEPDGAKGKRMTGGPLTQAMRDKLKRAGWRSS